MINELIYNNIALIATLPTIIIGTIFIVLALTGAFDYEL